MVLFEFNKIIRHKYNYYKKKYPDKVKDINQNDLYLIGLEKLSHLFPFCFSGITEEYIEKVISNKSNKIIIFCIGKEFNIKNIIGILVYHKTKLLNAIKYYILVLGTHEQYRNYGYGSALLNEFIKFIKNKHMNDNDCVKINKNIIVKILLKSVQSSVNFYVTHGFKQVNKDNINANKLFYKYESIDEIKNSSDKILEYTI